MDRTEQTGRNMLQAIEAPLYDVGVLSDLEMLPGLDAISAASVIARLPLLKYHNARGSHISLRPSGEHRYTVLDDLSEAALAKLAADGFAPCAVVETSAGNFQAWLKHIAMLPKLLGTFAAQTSPHATGRTRARRTGSASDGFPASPTANPNTGTGWTLPFVRARCHSGLQYPSAEAFHREVREMFEVREREREAQRLQRSLSPRSGPRFLSLDAFGHPQNTRTGPQQPTSPSA